MSAASYVARLADDSLAILLFHGVVPEQRFAVRNYTRKHLVTGYFEGVLQSILDAGGTPVTMDHVVEIVSGRQPLASRVFAVTFDDGFANNLEVAAPVLERLGIPATIYVTSGFIDENGQSWTDLIEASVEAAEAVELRGFAPELDGRHSTVEERRALLDAIRSYVKGTPGVDPYEFASRLCSSIDAGEIPRDPGLDRKLTWAEVAELDRHPLFTIGGHGQTHRILAFLNPDELQRELDTSMERITRHLGHSCRHYSYPEGLAHCFTPGVVDALKKRGVVCSPSAIDGVNSVGADPFALRRITVV